MQMNRHFNIFEHLENIFIEIEPLELRQNDELAQKLSPKMYQLLGMIIHIH